jgi:hypothetical protein
MTVTDIGDGSFHQGEPVWVMEVDGSQRPAEYVGTRELGTWFGGPPTVLVFYTDTRSGGAVEMDRVIPRETENEVEQARSAGEKPR